MQRHGHRRLDVLKIDIEGAEYGVLQDWVSRSFFPFRQLKIDSMSAGCPTSASTRACWPRSRRAACASCTSTATAYARGHLRERRSLE